MCFGNFYVLSDVSPALITTESIFQVEKDKLLMQIESARNGKSWDEIDSNANQVRLNLDKIFDL